jgi:uncharacterized protein YqhQ
MADHDDQHYYGGQAVIEGVMMRGLDRFGVAVRRSDGQVVTVSEPLQGLAVREGWHKWPLIRGNYMLVESLTLGWHALQFSANVLTAEEMEKHPGTAGVSPAGTGEVPAGPGAGLEAQPPRRGAGETPALPAQTAAPAEPALLSRVWMSFTTLLALALGIGLFIVLPTTVPQWLWGPQTAGIGTHSLLLNAVEGAVRLLVIVLYIAVISLMKYVRRVFQYHGAEHATINCYEAGEPVTVDNCARFSPLHPRCGTAFLLLVIVVKIVVGVFFGWPAAWLRIGLRLALLPLVAAVAYEILRWAGRHRDSRFARALAGPGLLLQMLTTRHPDREQLATAIYALAAVAPEVPLPADFALPRQVNMRLQPVTEQTPRPAGQVESNGYC